MSSIATNNITKLLAEAAKSIPHRAKQLSAYTSAPPVRRRLAKPIVSSVTKMPANKNSALKNIASPSRTKPPLESVSGSTESPCFTKSASITVSPSAVQMPSTGRRWGGVHKPASSTNTPSSATPISRLMRERFICDCIVPLRARGFRGRFQFFRSTTWVRSQRAKARPAK